MPEPATLFGVMVPHPSPVGTVSVSETVPVNPLTALIVTVVVAATPATVVGEVADSVKSWNLRVTVALCAKDPLVPVIVRV